jgi:hypothetical protein
MLDDGLYTSVSEIGDAEDQGRQVGRDGELLGDVPAGTVISTTACTPDATAALGSSSIACIAAPPTQGSTKATPASRSGQTAPNSQTAS